MKVFFKIILFSAIIAGFSVASSGELPDAKIKNVQTTEKEIKAFSYSVTQPFAGSQSPDDARIAAVAKGKTEALEKAGTYLETVSVVENFTLTKDQTIALASGILSVDVLSQKNFATDEGFGIILEMKIIVDTDVMNKRIVQRGGRAKLDRCISEKDAL
jgi:hypothetical protein